jgi:hypothetical protein
MKVSLGRAVLELVKGDITHEDVDAIVNAANHSAWPVEVGLTVPSTMPLVPP